jgi:hypothetical protein
MRCWCGFTGRGTKKIRNVSQKKRCGKNNQTEKPFTEVYI